MGWAGPLFPGHVASLGYEVLDWIEEYECHGPGDVMGEPVDLDDEFRDHVIQCYAIRPDTGRRLFDEVVLSRPKGRAKSELAGMIAVAEAFGPVRFDGWNADGQPVGRPVVSPLIKCLATEEGQAGNTYENVAFIAGTWGPDEHPDIYGGVSGIRQYQSGKALYLPTGNGRTGGEIRACSAGAASKDGGRETHIVVDETHLYVLRELKEMYGNLRRNMGSKRVASEPWLHQTTTAHRPGEMSIAEETMTAWRKGELDSSVYVNHREAKGRIDLADKDRTIAQLVELFGPAGPWHDFDRKYRSMMDRRENPDDETAIRYYLNRSQSGRDAWIATAVVERQARPTEQLEPGTAVALGFDGSINDDSTVLYAARMSDGFLFRLGVWSKPAGPSGIGWEVPRRDVLATIRHAFGTYKVSRLYADPHEWRSDIDTLAEVWPDEVFPWSTHRDLAMSAALDRLRTGLITGEIWHCGDPEMMEHFGNAFNRRKGGHTLARKEYPNSDRKIDSVIGCALALEARADAIAAGWGAAPSGSLTRVTGRASSY